MNKTKVHVLLPGILEITDHLGLQCGLSVKRIPTSCLAKVPWHSSLQSYPWGCGFSSQGSGVHELQYSLYFFNSVYLALCFCIHSFAHSFINLHIDSFNVCFCISWALLCSVHHPRHWGYRTEYLLWRSFWYSYCELYYWITYPEENELREYIAHRLILKEWSPIDICKVVKYKVFMLIL